jgi:hypothetical protein
MRRGADVKQRVRIVFGGCPRCHGKLLVLEKAHHPEITGEALDWRVVTGRCAGTCRLGPDDLA